MRPIIVSLLVCLSGVTPALLTDNAEESPTPVLIELFTSEGCSSCPPADDYVAQLVRTQPLKNVQIVALSEHVDYWNSLGWKDPFSSTEFSRRQRRYARRLETGVYTPQLVIDGGEDLVGSKRTDVLSAIYRASKRAKAEMDLSVAWSEDGSIDLSISIGDVPKGSGELVLWTALAEDGLIVDVARGENGGRELRHDGVARLLSNAGKIAANETRDARIAVDEGWNKANLRVVAFLEDSRDGRIVGVASAALSAFESER